MTLDLDLPRKQRWPCSVSHIPSCDFSVKYCFSEGVSSAERKFSHLDMIFTGKIAFIYPRSEKRHNIHHH